MTNLPTLHDRGFGELIGTSEPMRAMYDLMKRGGPTEATVLISGEAGVGKGLVARTLHAMSARSSAPFVSIDCSASAPTLIETELFGKGGAEKEVVEGSRDQAIGAAFARAAGGSLFLDEVTALSPEVQSRLLRVMEPAKFGSNNGHSNGNGNGNGNGHGTVTGLGSNGTRAPGVRIIACTHLDPQEAVTNGKLRQDVMYRLAVFPIHVPALRDRGADKTLLARHFLANLNRERLGSKRLSSSSLDAIQEYEWPGNVRELKNTIERAFILSDDWLDVVPLIERQTIPKAVETGGVYVPLGARLDEAERALIEATLAHFEGNKRRAAEVLGCSLKTLYNKLHRYAGTQPGRYLPTMAAEI